MKQKSTRPGPLALAALMLLSSACGSLDGGGGEIASEFRVPIEYFKLDNGLRIALSPDPTAPTVVVAVYYKVGLRLEPSDRTGFAHLFEHMMFQGSKNLPRGEFDRLTEGNGGFNNGSTRFDFTNYFEIVPAHMLEPVLWAEADRMSGLDITQSELTNQQGVVMNEVKVNVLNQPYGGFPWLDVPQIANVNWYNAHNFYGDLEDLQAATLEDVTEFFDTFYAPNNAALAVVGDFEPADARAWVEKYFAEIPPGPPVPAFDISEPRQEQEKRASRVDPLASRPALAVAYHVPERMTPEHFAMGLLDQVLLQGEDSWLHQRLVQEEGMTGAVRGGINLLGDMFNYDGPMLWTVYLFHDTDRSAGEILAAFDEVIGRASTEPVDRATLDRALVKARSDVFSSMEGLFGFGRADLMASFALFDDDPGLINDLEKEFARVTPELIMDVAREYLRPTNRTILEIVPGAEAEREEGPR